MGFCLDGAGHLKDGGESFDFEKAGYANGADFRDASEVIARHIDDHNIFRACFGMGTEFAGELGVAGGPQAAGGGSFHGFGDQAGAVEFKKKFRRGAADRPVVEGQERAIALGLGMNQA